MRVLAIDTALNACSLALTEDGVTRACVSRVMSAGHAEHLAPMAADLFREAGVLPLDLDRIGVVIGPGQFAGVRIGLAFALGLAIGGRAAVLGAPSLEALAESLGGAWVRPRAAIIDARRGEVYCALYAGPGAPLIAPMLAPVESAVAALARAANGTALHVCGSGAHHVASAAPPGSIIDEMRTEIDPLAVARLAASGDPASRPPKPLYLRAPDAAPAKPSRFAEVAP
jgi:tRNA threonylcarbamoyladenosine biosynthesis protein TsaB